MDYRQIIEMPTSLGRTEINANPNSSGFHESCLRAYHILAKVKWLLDKKTDAEVIRELICLMESTHELAGAAQKERA